MNEVHKYAEDVVEGKIVTCALAKLACQRHLDDLSEGHKRGLYFDEAAAQEIFDFFELLRHPKGKWARQPFVLEPWQKFIEGSLFGWKKRSDNLRRFITSYEEVPRKNGKSTRLAGRGLYMLMADGEYGAEIYSAATTRDQAKMIFDPAAQMARISPGFSDYLTMYKKNISYIDMFSKFEPLSSDANSLEGLNPHAALIDEMQAHKSREVWDVLESAIEAREQPMLSGITTAGFNRQGIAYELREYLVNILNGLVHNDSFFGIIHTIDDGDDWKSEETWKKANPNYGISVNAEHMKNAAAKAIDSPRSQTNFLTKHLNVWVSAFAQWMNMERWFQCNEEFDIDDFAGEPCYLSLDLASKTDIAVLMATFKRDDEYFVHAKYYIPEGVIESTTRKQAHYKEWADKGYLTLTPGDIIDFDFIKEDIREFHKTYEVLGVPYDPYQAHMLATQLNEEGVRMIEFGAQYKHVSAPMKELEGVVISRKLRHNNNPVLSWMAGNVVVKADRRDNISPTKERPENKIDGIVTLIMGIGMWMHDDRPKTSVYEERGVRTL